MQLSGDFEIERFRGSEVDDELKARGLDHWQIDGFGAPENPTDIDGALTIGVGLARAIAH